MSSKAKSSGKASKATKATITKVTKAEKSAAPVKTVKSGKLNKITEKAGLTFNVNACKSKLKDYYGSSEAPCPKFAGGQIAITAVLEGMFKVLLLECRNKIRKTTTGNCIVTRDALLNQVILQNSSFVDYYATSLSKFDKDLLYRNLVPITDNEFKAVVSQVDDSLSFDPQARNFISYLLLKVFNDLACAGGILLRHSKKSTLDGRTILFAIDMIHLPDTIASKMHDNIATVLKAFGKDLEDQGKSADAKEEGETIDASGEVDQDETTDQADQDDDDVVDGNEFADEPVSELVTKGKSSKTTTPKLNAKKSAKTIDIEDEDAIVDDQDDAEEEVDIAPKKSKAGAKPSAKKATITKKSSFKGK
jgi:hypothetical protein